jgi:hypothetical protein
MEQPPLRRMAVNRLMHEGGGVAVLFLGTGGLFMPPGRSGIV